MTECGHHVCALVTDRRSAQKSIPWVFTSPQVEIVTGDVRDREQVQQIMVDEDVVVHLAYVLPPQTNEQPALAQAVNSMERAT